MTTLPFAREEDRLLIELADLYEVWAHASRRLYDGRLRWRQVNGTDYLLRIKKGQSNGQSLGPRTSETEALFEASQADEEMVEVTWERLQLKGRMLKAARVPMISDVAGEALRGLDVAGLLGNHLRVVGSTAIPAYEIAAGIKFDASLHATEDVDMSWVGPAWRDGEGLRSPVLEALKRSDSTWTVNQERPFQLRNRHGDILDVLVAPSVAATFPKREAIRAVATEGQEDLLGGHPLDRVVLDSAGLPARVVAPDPRLFALHKLCLSNEPERRQEKRSKDRLQALAVLEWVREHMIEYPLDDTFVQTLSPRLAHAWQSYQEDKDHLTPAKPPARGRAKP